MEFFTRCSGECIVCACSGGCIAGHGDDDFIPASKEMLMTILETKKWAGRDRMLTDKELSYVKAYLLKNSV
jgi:hypothetical protein